MPIKARDVRANIKELGFEQGMVKSMEALAEEQSSVRLTLREMAEMLQRCIDATANMVEVGDALGKQMNDLRRREEQSKEIDNG